MIATTTTSLLLRRRGGSHSVLSSSASSCLLSAASSGGGGRRVFSSPSSRINHALNLYTKEGGGISYFFNNAKQQHLVIINSGKTLFHRWVSNGSSNGSASTNKVKNGVVEAAESVQSTSPPPSTSTSTTFLQRFIGPKPMPPQNTFQWYVEMTLLCTVFAISGTTTMVLVRPAVSNILGLHGSMKDGPWSYRLCSIFIMTPIYPIVLVSVGTIFGRHAYFRHFGVKMFTRFGIPAELMDKYYVANSKHFKKW
jgi:hypothetical protein